jgi:rifampicin phosphotransferase
MDAIVALADLGRNDLAIGGGKAANLGELLRAGLPVPAGFCVTTAGYGAFVEGNGIGPLLGRILESCDCSDPEALRKASEAIEALFRAGRIPSTLEETIVAAYSSLGSPPSAVSVRSSATAEDLPDLSFAGQQDTFLNVVGEEAVLRAVVRCWASLWTARAIGYRARNGIPSKGLSLAVVIQAMIQSVSSGVLFTANPLTGDRTETIVEATFGFGEALVSGRVEPDHYVVDTLRGVIREKRLGRKALVISGQEGGGTRTETGDHSALQAIPDDAVVALSAFGQRAAAQLGAPQDLEWAWAEGRLYVLQSRPITSLFPLPEGLRVEPLQVLLSFGVWQGMLEPFTPLGRDLFRHVVSGVARMFGLRIAPAAQRVFFSAGERLWVNLDRVLRNRVGRRMLEVALPSIDPVCARILEDVGRDPRLAPREGIGLRGLAHVAWGVVPILARVVANLLAPALGRRRIEKVIRANLDLARESTGVAADLPALAGSIGSFFERRVHALMPSLLAGVIAGQVPLQILLRTAGRRPGGENLCLELTRGLPYNVTTRMDLALWRTSRTIAADPVLAGHLAATSVSDLVAQFHDGELPWGIRTAVGAFLDVYGARGLGEVDIGRPRWREDPSPLFSALKSYLDVPETVSPAFVFARSEERAESAAKELAALVRAQGGGWFESRVVRVLAHRVRELGGLRETPKFAVVRLFGVWRAALLAHGRALADQGLLDEADDLVFLHLDELADIGRPGGPAVKAVVRERRAVFEREKRRSRVPRLLASDGRAFHDAVEPSPGSGGNVLVGSPVSGGVAQGLARVVLDPHDAGLSSGEILVCPATDPSWTPLFLAAGALVMEVGGLMTHGSVVAREYGIPAVVGVMGATTRIRTGQMLRVDGGSGRVTVLTDPTA